MSYPIKRVDNSINKEYFVYELKIYSMKDNNTQLHLNPLEKFILPGFKGLYNLWDMKNHFILPPYECIRRYGLDIKQIPTNAQVTVGVNEMVPLHDGGFQDVLDISKKIWIKQNRIIQIMFRESERLVKTKGALNIFPTLNRNNVRMVVTVEYGAEKPKIQFYGIGASLILGGEQKHRMFYYDNRSSTY